jgi:hypothetical protein
MSNQNELPPCPRENFDPKQPIPFVWRDWFNKLYNIVGGTVSGIIKWTQLDFTGSKLTDIVTRLHSSLQSLGWGVSGHTGTANKVAAFDNAGAAIQLSETGTGSVVLNNNPEFTGYIDIDAIANPASPAAGVARFHASTANGFTRFEQDNEAPTNLVIARDNAFIVRNTSGSAMSKGAVVYVTGSTGNVPNVSLAKADSATTMPAVGILLDPINNNAFGQCMKLGIIANFDTSAFAAGAKLWVSSSVAGVFQNTSPTSPNLSQRIANVLVSGVGNGSLLAVTGADTHIEGGGGSGDVVGPAGATSGNVALFDGVTGKLIKDGGTLGTAAFTASTAYDVAGAAAAAQAASLPLHGKADTAGAADTATTATNQSGGTVNATTGNFSATVTTLLAATGTLPFNANITTAAAIAGYYGVTRSNVAKGYFGLDASDKVGIIDSAGTPRAMVSTTGMDVTGTLSATGQITSTLAIGTAPFVITSTTQVANLNVAKAELLATARTINGTSFNGSANIDAVPSWKVGQTTRDISTASGAQNIAHGLGRVPKYVHIRAQMVFSASVTMECNGYYDGTSQSGMYIGYTEGTTTATTDNIFQSTAAALGLNNVTSVNPFSGATKASGVITVDGTNIIITWTKSGSPTGTANLAWEVT